MSRRWPVPRTARFLRQRYFPFEDKHPSWVPRERRGELVPLLTADGEHAAEALCRLQVVEEGLGDAKRGLLPEADRVAKGLDGPVDRVFPQLRQIDLADPFRVFVPSHPVCSSPPRKGRRASPSTLPTRCDRVADLGYEVTCRTKSYQGDPRLFRPDPSASWQRRQE